MSARAESGRRWQPRVGLFAALALASALSALSAWALTLPPRAARPLTHTEPRPDLLDKPHRHLAAAPSGSAHSQ